MSPKQACLRPESAKGEEGGGEREGVGWGGVGSTRYHG